MSYTISNIFEALPVDLSCEIFEVLAETASVKIERIISKGHTTPETTWYDQRQQEWVIVLQGKAVLDIEGSPSVEMLPGDYINIPAHVRHRVAWTEPNQETIWLAVHY